MIRLLPNRIALGAFLDRMRTRTCHACYIMRRRWLWLGQHVRVFKTRCRKTCRRWSSCDYCQPKFYLLLRCLTIIGLERVFTHCPETANATTAVIIGARDGLGRVVLVAFTDSISIFSMLHWPLCNGFATGLFWTWNSCVMRRTSKPSSSHKQCWQCRSYLASVRVVLERRVENEATGTASMPVVFNAKDSEMRGMVGWVRSETGQATLSKGWGKRRPRRADGRQHAPIQSGKNLKWKYCNSTEIFYCFQFERDRETSHLLYMHSPVVLSQGTAY